jgi:hypothetical protein
MKLMRPVLILALCAFGMPGRAQVATSLTNNEVLELVGSGLSPDVVIAKIKTANCDFDTSPTALKALKAANVPDAIILAMVQAPSKTTAVAVEKVIRIASVTCVAAKEIPMYTTVGDKTPVASPKCGEKISVLDEGEWDKIRAENGIVGYMASFFVSKPSQSQASAPSTPSQASTHSSYIPASMLRAVAWRAVPWVTTTYYQQQGSAYTNCAGGGSWIGNTYQGNASCTTQYTPAENVPINWQHYTIYNLVETSDSTLIITCTRNWAFSKCVYLVPGSTFPFEYKNGKISVTGHKGGKSKEQSLEYDIASSVPKSR